MIEDVSKTTDGDSNQIELDLFLSNFWHLKRPLLPVFIGDENALLENRTQISVGEFVEFEKEKVQVSSFTKDEVTSTNGDVFARCECQRVVPKLYSYYLCSASVSEMLEIDLLLEIFSKAGFDIFYNKTLHQWILGCRLPGRKYREAFQELMQMFSN